jgi:uncharacterized protein involved in exopolysaccharide biosynthesis
MSDSEYSDVNVPQDSKAAGASSAHSERMLMVREVRQTNNLRDYLAIFFKHKRTIAACFALLSILGCVVALVYREMIYSPRFEARSSILVKFGWENYYPDPSLGKRDTPAVDQAQMIGAEISILKSRELKEIVLNALTPRKIFPGLWSAKSSGLGMRREALLLLNKDIKVEPAKKSDIIEVSFEGSDAQSAAAVVNRLVGAYIDKRAEIYKDPRSALFLQNKVDFYRQKLSKSLENLKAFAERTKIIDFDQQRKMLLDERLKISVALDNTANQMKEAGQTIAEFEKELKSLPQSELSAAASERTGDAKSKLLSLKLQEQGLTAKYKGTNPLIEGVRAQIAIVKNYIQSVSSANPAIAPADPVYQEIQKQILNSKAKLSALSVRYTGTQSRLGEMNKELQFFAANENQYRMLSAAVTSNKRIFQDYLQKLEEAKVYNELGRDKMTSVSVIEPASAPLSPANPPPPLILLFALAIVFALFASLGIAWILEMNKQVMSTAMEAEKKLDLPVLIAIAIKD